MKINRTFIILACLLVFVLVMWFLIVASQVREDIYTPGAGGLFTATVILATNSAIAEQNITTSTAAAISTGQANTVTTEIPK